MADFISFYVAGPPQGKGRARSVRIGRALIHYTPANTRSYEGMVRFAAQEAMKGAPPLEGPVSVQITAVFDIPKSFSRKKRDAALANLLKPAKRPDIDNIIKAVVDAINGVVFKDDSQIVRGDYAKVYGPAAGVAVTVRPL